MAQFKAILRSFVWAGRGIARSIRTGRNLRLQLTAGGYAAALGLLAGLDGTQWAVLALCVGGVIAGELVNTALENVRDAAHPQHHPLVGAAKDAAAGAVLVLAIAAGCVAVFLFGPWLLGGGLLAAAGERPWLLPAFLITLPLAALYVARAQQNKKKK